MDPWLPWKFMRGLLAYGALSIAIASLIYIWRMRGISNWRRSLRNELNGLKSEIETAGKQRKQALAIVLDYCRSSLRATSPELKELAGLPEYLCSIASCFHPSAEKPELRITVGRLLSCAREVVQWLERILHRPGFQRVKQVRIRHIRTAYEWYSRVNKYRIMKFYRRYQKTIARIFQLRLVFLPDPLLWVAHLSNRLTILTLTRCLLVDVYLFLGKLAIYAYDEEEQGKPFRIQEDELEETLEGLNSLWPSEPSVADPRIKAIRSRLAGFTAMVISTPTLKDWQQAVREAAGVVAEKYFPDAGHPLEEAALGPILARSQAWIQSICETEKVPLVKKFHGIRIEALYDIKSFADGILTESLRNFIRTTWGAYRWVKWPLKAYRLFRKGSPLGIALEVGWVVVKQSFVRLTCLYTFDKACQELETIYRQSLPKNQDPR
ncbi:MAG: hypothetical protein Q8P24_12775 [Desulfobacterales bacterium]|nr:hypothetical protein [Desulfobacterales bacterium]